MSEVNFTPEKMIQFRHDETGPSDAHWCVAMIPEDPSATVTYLQGRAMQNLTLQQAEDKAAELNARMGANPAAA